MKATFSFTPRTGYNMNDRLYELFNNSDFRDYIELMAKNSSRLHMELKPAAVMTEKMKLYAFYQGPLLDCAVMAYEEAGWEQMDKVKADYMLKKECAKDIMFNKDGQQEYFLIDKSNMNKERLRKFVSDCLYHLEFDLDFSNVPDSEQYKMYKKTGRILTDIDDID